MPTAALRSPMPATAEELFAWHTAPGALDRLLPPWSGVRIERRGEVAEGSTVTLSVPVAGPLRLRWVARHHDVRRPEGFSDTQDSGPFAAWTHHHRFADGQLLDEIVWRAGLLAAPARFRIPAQLERTLAWRHERTRRDLERHRPWRDRPRLVVGISGATGLVGGALTPFLTTGGHGVRRFVRGAAPGGIPWDPIRGQLDHQALDGLDAVVHLAGEPVGTHWTQGARERIRDSRVDGTRLISERLSASVRRGGRVRTLIVASGINGYADGEDIHDEGALLAGGGFLGGVVRAWEGATRAAQEAGIRVVHLRTGMVLSPAGGALARMLTPASLGLGGRIGDGRQWISWIDLDDLVGLIHHALYDHRWSGPVNACAPAPVRQAEFAATLARVLRRPALAPMPARVVRALFGQMGEELLLGSLRVVPSKAQAYGFTFHASDLEPALRFNL